LETAWLTPYCINNREQIIGNIVPHIYGSDPVQAFYYDTGAITAHPVPLTDVGALGGYYMSFAIDINERGTMIGNYYADQGLPKRAFIYNYGSSPVQIPNQFGGQAVQVHDINNKGQIVGRATNEQGIWHAFVYQNGVMTDLDALLPVQGFGSDACAINDNGQIAIEGRTNSYLYTNGNVIDMGYGFLPTRGQFSLNNNGQVLGQRYARPALFSDGIVTDLNDLVDPAWEWWIGCGAGPQTEEYNESKFSLLNDAGQIVGVYTKPTIENGCRSFIMTPGAWSATGTGSWGNEDNWAVPDLPSQLGDTATFGNSSGSSSATITLDGGRSVSHIVFNNSAGSYTVSPGSPSGNLILDNNEGFDVTLLVQRGTHTIAAPVGIRRNLIVTVASNAGLNVSGNISEYGGSWSLTKAGEGTLTLSGSNTYTGQTVIQFGTLRLSSSGQISTASEIITETDGKFEIDGGTHTVGYIDGSGTTELLNGAYLTATHISQNVLNVGPACSIFLSPLGGDNSLQVGNALTVSGSLSLGGHSHTLSSAIVLNGGLTNGTLIKSGTGNFDGRSGIVMANLQGAVGLTKTTTGLLDLRGTNSYTGGTVINGGPLRFFSPSALPPTPSTGSITINADGALVAFGPYTTVMGWLASQKIATGATGAIALTGSSTESINMGTYAGYGNLSLGAASVGIFYGYLTPAGNTYYIGGGGGTLWLNRTDILTGLGKSVVVGNGAGGTVIVPWSNTYTGGTTINAGVLQVNPNGTLGSGSILVNPAGNLTYNVSTSKVVSNYISGSGTLQKIGTGTLILDTPVNDVTGPVIISSGTLRLGNGGGVMPYWYGGSVANSGALEFNYNGDLAVHKNVTGTGSLEQKGPGTLILSGQNTYTGNTKVSGGALEFAGGIGIGTTPFIDIQNGTASFMTTDINNTGLDIFIASSGTLLIDESIDPATVGDITGSNGLIELYQDLWCTSYDEINLRINRYNGHDIYVLSRAGCGADASAVPEPATTILLILSAGVILVHCAVRRRKERTKPAA
jgi:probable HAF family extracellular repeat protein/autotransporter-associated beta strand protein